MKYLCIALLKLYKATLSKLKGGKRCIYTPSCSVYSMEAYAQHGFFCGKLANAETAFEMRSVGKRRL